MQRHSPLVLLVFAVLLLVACGGSDAAEVTAASDDDAPIPVEPDGGIGDGAEPLPGAPDANDEGTWHGEEVAVTNCPGTQWQRVQASEFSFSVPVDFVEADVGPIDSEVGMWSGPEGMSVNFDYGWYSGSVSGSPGAESQPVDYSGVVGALTVVRQAGQNMVEVYFPAVEIVDSQPDKLSMLVTFPDQADEITARCIVGSIAWT